MRYDAGSRSRVATPWELKTEIANLKAAREQRVRDSEECKRRIDVYDPSCSWRRRHDELVHQDRIDAGRLHNLEYELKCSRGLNDADDTEWRPASSTYFLNDKY